MTIHRQGFTVVELLVVIVIIGILITIVSLQAGRGRLVSRDKERENDVMIISTFLETAYKSGQVDGVIIPTAQTNATPLGYPSTVLTSNPTNSQSKAILGAIDPDALKSPFKGTLSLKEASNATGISGNTAGGVTLGATAANDSYIYQPLTGGGALCTNANTALAAETVIAPRLVDACVKYIIYYFSETTGAIQSKSSINSNSNGL